MTKSVLGLFLGLYTLLNIGCQIDTPLILPSDTREDTLIINNDPFLVFPGLKEYQSMVFYNGKALFLMSQNGHLVCDVFDLISKEKEAELNLPYGKYQLPHANVSCLGSELFDTKSVFPPLYVSAWNNKRQAFVYNISLSGSVYESSLVQVIDPSSVSNGIIGNGYLDWVVDGENQKLYSIAYGLEGSARVADGNCTKVCQFQLPALDKPIISLSNSDVLDSFILPVILVSQDKYYFDNHVFIVAGAPEEQKRFPPKLYDIQLLSKSLKEYPIPLDGEPEGFCFYQGRQWLNMYGSSIVYNLNTLIRL